MGGGGKGGDQITGYWYSFTIHMGISRGPINELVEIHVGDRRAWPLGYTKTVVSENYTPTPDGSGWGDPPDTWEPPEIGDTD